MPIDLYPNISKIKRNGTWQNLPGFVQQSGDADIKAMIANSESSTTAQYAHPEGSYFILNDILYKAIIDIAVNDTIAVGTNCKVAILCNDINEIENDINDLIIYLNYLENGFQNFTEGYGLLSDGTLVQTDGVSVSDYVPVTGGHSISTVSASALSNRQNIRLIEYKADKSFNDYWGANPTKSVVTKSSTAFVRLAFVTGFEATITDNTTSTLIYKAKKVDSLNDRIDSRLENDLPNEDWDDIIPDSRHDKNTNYIDKAKIISGYINSSGVYTPYTTLWCTDYIPMSEGEVFYHGLGVYTGAYYAYYDADKNVVATGGTLGDLANPFTVPANAVYGRFTIIANPTGSSESDIWIFTQNGMPDNYKIEYYFGDNMSDAVNTVFANPTNPTKYTGMDIQAFNSGICIGDSLTIGIFNYDNSGSTGYQQIEEMSYPSALQRMTGIEVENAGTSGATSLEWYTVHENDDLSGNQFAIIQFGVNDVARYGQGWTQDSIDGYTAIISKLKTDNPNIKIFVSTVMPAIAYPPANYATFNSGLKSFVENLNDTDVIVLDMATYGNTIASQYNAGHLSAYGYWRLAKDYANYISFYMHNNGMEFLEIQFIGTDKHYN